MISETIGLDRVISVLEDLPFRTETSLLVRLLEDNSVEFNDFLCSMVKLYKREQDQYLLLSELNLEIQEMFNAYQHTTHSVEYTLYDVRSELDILHKHILYKLHKNAPRHKHHLIGLCIHNSNILVLEFYRGLS